MFDGLFSSGDSGNSEVSFSSVLAGAGTVLQAAAPYVGTVVSGTNPVPYAPPGGVDAPIAPAPVATAGGTPAEVKTATAAPGASGKGIIALFAIGALILALPTLLKPKA